MVSSSPDRKKNKGTSTLSRLRGTILKKRESNASLRSVDNVNGHEHAETKSLVGSDHSIPSADTRVDEARTTEELHRKLDEVVVALQSKTHTIAELEERVTDLSSSLNAARTDVEAKQSALRASKEANSNLGKDAAAAQERFAKLREEHEHNRSELEATRHELDGAKATVAAKSSAVDNEHNARLHAENVLQAALTETEHLKALRHQDQIELMSRAAKVEELTTRFEELSAAVAALRTVNEEKSAGILQLERDIQEASEDREKIHHEHRETLSYVKDLEGRLGQRSQELAGLAAELKVQEVAHKEATEATKAEYEKTLQAAVDNAKREVEAISCAETQLAKQQLSAAHQAAINQLEGAHHAFIESKAKAFERCIAEKDRLLSTAQEELAQTRAELDSATFQVSSLKVILEEVRQKTAPVLEAAVQVDECIGRETSADIAAAPDEQVVSHHKADGASGLATQTGSSNALQILRWWAAQTVASVGGRASIFMGATMVLAAPLLGPLAMVTGGITLVSLGLGHIHQMD